MTRQSVGRFAALLLVCTACQTERPSDPRPVVPNDNRTTAGEWRGDTLVFVLEARLGAWTPDASVDSAMTVQAFAAADGTPRIPGPLLRAPEGTMVVIEVTNHVADSTLVVHGLRPGIPGDDTIAVAPGVTRSVVFTAPAPGTYLYWGSTSGNRMEHSERHDGPLAGAFVVDPAGAEADTSERIFVITTLDILPDSTKPEPRDDLFDLAINGLSWPYTEQLHHTVGDTIRWRWINATATPHPMHLHGFHFRVTAEGSGDRDSTYAPATERLAVTELLFPGHTARLVWVPTRPGNWLFHCHIADHVVPFPERPDSVRDQDHQMPTDHAKRSMSGLVMGINVRERGQSTAPAVPPTTARQVRLLVQEATARVGADSARARGYLMPRNASAPSGDSLSIPGPLLVLTRGTRNAITVVNHLSEPTSVHWHGMELESYYDGVAGWSGADARTSPMVMPGDSFVAVMTPPRAGTFMYHPHMDEDDQLGAGLFGPLVVLEPGEHFDPATDLLFMLGDAIVAGARGPTVNGARSFAPLQLRTGVTYRLRFLNMNTAAPANVRLMADALTLTWRPLAKDGAMLPGGLTGERPAELEIGVGETYDFTWRPTREFRGVLEFDVFDTKAPFRIPITVRR